MNDLEKSGLTEYFFSLVKANELFSLSDNYLNHFEDFIKNHPACDRLAFEFELVNEQKKVDFHINLKTLHFRKKIVKELEQKAKSSDSDWDLLIQLLKKWNDENSELNQFLDAVFLEFDFTENVNELHLPAFFARLNPKNKTKQEIFSLCKEVIVSLKGEEFYQNVHSFLEKCIEATPQGAYLGFIGIMLSRPEKVLRLNIHKLHHDEVLPFLDSLGWKGDGERIVFWLRELMNYCDKVILSFDVFDGMILPKIGLEAFIEKQPSEDYRWNQLMDKLVQHQLCTTEKREVFSTWEKKWFPFELKWHPDLIAYNLTLQKTEFPLIKRIVSHIKITLDGDEAPTSKIYLGVGQTSISSESSPSFITDNTLENAIEQGLKFLTRKQNQAGAWLDYLIPDEFGDEYMTSYVASILKTFFDAPLTSALIQRAYTFLRNRWRENEGLGFNLKSPSDSDSISWFLRLCELVDQNDFLRVNSKLLDRYRNEDGGLGTYSLVQKDVIKDFVDEYRIEKSDNNFIGWQVSHNCVTANAAYFDERSLNYILDKIKIGDKLEPYWWENDYYVLFWAYQAILKNEVDNPEIKDYFIDRVNFENGATFSVFEKAFYIALCALLEIKNDTIERMAKELISCQKQKGNWDPSALLLVPMPNDLNREGIKRWNRFDVNGIMTTSSVLMALELYRKTVKSSCRI